MLDDRLTELWDEPVHTAASGGEQGDGVPGELASAFDA